MGGLEVAVIGLGTAVAKTAVGVWLGDHKFAAGTSGALIDFAAARLVSAREQRQFRRLWEQAAELIADRIEPFVAREFPSLQENERLAAIDAVQMTFDKASLTEADLFARDLDAGYLDRHIRDQDAARTERAGLSADGTALYDLLMRECCAYVIEVVRTLPTAGITAVTEVLRRERQVLDDLRTVLERLPVRRGLLDFERDYRQLVANVLDHVEFFGATLTDSSRRYPLSVAYLSLTVSGEFQLRRPGAVTIDFPGHTGTATAAPTTRVEDVLGSTRRLFVRGQAGLGKTTLLQWIAVQSARGTFPEYLADWNDTVPFFVPLRRHADRPLPTPERFVTEAGRHIAAEMPPGWAHERLRSGHAIVLVDGVDELSQERRGEARQWLRELVAAFPAARYVVTSRPAAAPADWLGRDDFDVAELEPMSRTDVPVFISRWHAAMREQCHRAEERDELIEYEQQLLDALAHQRHLRALARYPLLCALLCALHRDRRGELPGNRMELYEVALQMLLERRDRERRIERGPTISRTDKTLLLRDIAYWLIRNGWTSAPADRVKERIAKKITGMPQIAANANEVYRLLLERSGLIREPVEGQTDFVHRSFQEYLAAAEAVTTDDIGVLVANAYTDLWSDVVVLAAGHATTSQRAELICGLLTRAQNSQNPRVADALRLVAVASLETSPELPPELRSDVREATASLLPPKTMAAARTLSRAGGFTLDLLAQTQPQTATEVAATIRAASESDDPAALRLLARFGKDPRKPVVKELLRAWPRFDPEEYAQTVLPHYPRDNDWFEIRDRLLIPALRHLGNLEQLSVSPQDGEPVDLRFVHDLPRLRSLMAYDVTDFEALIGSSLTRLWQTLLDMDELPPLSLAPLGHLPDLASLMVVGRRIKDLSALSGLERLDDVHLYELGDAEALAELQPLHQVSSFGAGGMPDLQDLRPLSFLKQPTVISVQKCPSLMDLSATGTWQKSLTMIQLRSCPAIDLSTLAAASGLCRLDLTESDVLDLSPLRNLPDLNVLGLGGDGPLPDLGQLRDFKSLARLRLWVEQVDLSPLAGREGLAIDVRRSCIVHGADQLGPGSRIVRL